MENGAARALDHLGQRSLRKNDRRQLGRVTGRSGDRPVWYTRHYSETPMKNTKVSHIALLLPLLALAMSCGGGPDLSNADKPKPTATSTPPTELELSGVYNVEGSDENKANPYQGLLTITNQDDAYLFKWNTSRRKPSGVGVQMGDALAVTYADPTNGKGCGVALYKIAPDGSLDGKIAKWGEYKFGAEKAVRVEGDKFEGKYKVTGTTNEGTTYEGTIDVQKNGNGYQFVWRTGKDSTGFGIWRGDRTAIGFGGRQCSFGLYKVLSARSLDGHWGSQRTIGFGTETAKRQ